MTLEEIESLHQVAWVLSGEADPPILQGVGETKLCCMQPLPRQTQLSSQPRVCPVRQVPSAGMSQCREVDTDLVCTARLELHLHEAGPAVGFTQLIGGDGLASSLDDGEAPFISRVPSDRRVDRPFGGIR